jgi:hypothetical protein
VIHAYTANPGDAPPPVSSSVAASAQPVGRTVPTNMVAPATAPVPTSAPTAAVAQGASAIEHALIKMIGSDSPAEKADHLFDQMDQACFVLNARNPFVPICIKCIAHYCI